MAPNPVVLAAAVSQRTERVRIAILGPLMPLANRVRVAEELAMLDCISGGRVIALFLRGTPDEQRAYSADGHADPDTRGITQEATLLVLKAWHEREPFTWKGDHFNFESISVWPRTLQELHPPVFFSGNSNESVEFAAANHLNLAIGFAPVQQVAKNVQHYLDCAAEVGWTPTSDNVLYRARALVAESDEQADAITGRSHATPGAGEGGGAPGAAGFQFHGTRKRIVDQVAAYREAGVGIVDVAFAGIAYGRGGTKRALSEFAEVLPIIQSL
jgi:alkanesulfonate monooxygenase SsuD/methylene tetrahydromethanopterin reductase-like flavin-dependent oxidoreductase (luciferase family)